MLSCRCKFQHVCIEAEINQWRNPSKQTNKYVLLPKPRIYCLQYSENMATGTELVSVVTFHRWSVLTGYALTHVIFQFSHCWSCSTAIFSVMFSDMTSFQRNSVSFVTPFFRERPPVLRTRTQYYSVVAAVHKPDTPSSS